MHASPGRHRVTHAAAPAGGRRGGADAPAGGASPQHRAAAQRKHSSFFVECMKPKEAVSLSAAERSRLYDAFQVVVPEGKAQVSNVAELKKLFVALHLRDESMTDEKLQEIFTAADADGDGNVEFDELVRYLESEKRAFEIGAAPNADLLDTFVAWGGNKDASGSIEAAPLFANLKQVMRDFELDFDMSCMMDDAAVGSTDIDFAQFEEVFGELLTNRHFQQPCFQSLFDGPGTAPARRPTDPLRFT